MIVCAIIFIESTTIKRLVAILKSDSLQSYLYLWNYPWLFRFYKI